MSGQFAKKPGYEKGGFADESNFHRIRITLTSRNVKHLEKGSCFSWRASPCSRCFSSLSPGLRDKL